jgi:molybdopterin converting factor small subunit
MLTIHFYAGFKVLAGCAEGTLPGKANLTVGGLRTMMNERWPAIAPLLERSRIAVNDQIVDDGFAVPEGADIALLPPVSGGNG